VNDGLQIYVIYFLIVFKMKKIILLFFTFLGICSCFSQNIPKSTDAISGTVNQVANTLPLKTDSIKLTASARLYPNPAKNKVEIEIKGFEPGYIKLQLLNNNGKLLREEKRLALTGNETIVFMFAETPGLYYIIFKQRLRMLKNKLVIQ
jgi:Secretion system C-terminal sorting domain